MTPRPLPYSTVCDLPGQAEALTDFYAIVDRYPDAIKNQHAIRRWEYAMALSALTGWQLAKVLPAIVAANEARKVDGLCRTVSCAPSQICDVGGAGSNFWQVLTEVTSEEILLIDPKAPVSGKPAGRCRLYAGSVEEYAANYPHGQFDILTCISVIEHVKEVRPFLRACHMLLKPGGLLFLTTDFWDADGPDTAHFHWMRERIYTADSIRALLISSHPLGFVSVGATDWHYHGPMVYDYSVASLALVKKGTR